MCGGGSVAGAVQKASYTEKPGQLTRVIATNCANWTLYEDGNGFESDGILNFVRAMRGKRDIDEPLAALFGALGFSIFYVTSSYSVNSAPVSTTRSATVRMHL